MRSAVLVALIAIVAIVAVSVDAYTYRVYRGNIECKSSGSGNSVRFYFGSIGSCLRYNSTVTNTNQYTKLTKCNTTGKTGTSEDFGSSSTCSGSSSTRTFVPDQCTEIFSTTPASSYRVTCSAGSVAFSAVIALFAVLFFLF